MTGKWFPGSLRHVRLPVEEFSSMIEPRFALVLTGSSKSLRAQPYSRIR